MFKNFILRVTKVQQIHSTVRNLNTKVSQKQVNYEANYNLEQVQIDAAIKLQPNLSIYSNELWHRSHQTFLNHGLETISFLRIVTGNPSVLKKTPEQIISSLEIWRSCQFGEKLLYLMLTKYPELLDCTDGHRLMKHISYLKDFAGTNKNVWKLLMNSPDLLEQSEQCIAEKIAYLTGVMRIEVPEIIKSEALSKSFTELRCRHVYLHRLGLFKPRPPKADPNAPTKNSRLYQIADTSEKTFVTKICHTTLPEYEAFKELYARELQRKQYDDADSDFDEDE